jgi:hypothetical protein
MIWKKLKKLIIPLIIAKLIILVFFIFSGDVNSIVQKRQKFIRIVRNEEERSISIKLRGKKKAKPLREKEGEISTPIVD